MTAPLLFEKISLSKGFSLGHVTLNSPQTLNALSLEMLEMYSTLIEWEKDPTVVGVFLDGAGPKAFCAGGDVKKLFEAIEERKKNPGVPTPFPDLFFEKEYKLDYKIHTYTKPFIVWGHGIVMGGGLGLMAGASTRVVTENTKMAMPEITIGLYPDVGASYFLNKMPRGVGLYLGLTATRLNAADAIFCELADVLFSSDEKDTFLEAVKDIKWEKDSQANRTLVKEVAAAFSVQTIAPAPTSLVKEHLSVTQELTDFPDILSLGQAWKKSYESKLSPKTNTPLDDFILLGLKTFLSGSPTSAAVIFEQLKRGKNLSLKECFLMEYNMTLEFARNHDFPEGIRALLVDKDNKPQWSARRIEDVRNEDVQRYFPSAKESHPLKEM